MPTSLCPECKYEGLTNGSDLCPNCGANWSNAGDDDYKFKVSQQNSCEMNLSDDDLGIESPGQMLENGASDAHVDKLSGSNFDEPIGRSKPMLPEHDDIDTGPTGIQTLSNCEINSTDENLETSALAGGLKKLSDDELKAIEAKLYGDNKSSKRTGSHPKQITSSEDSNTRPFDSEPIVAPKREKSSIPKLEEIDDNRPQPKMASRGRGIAYFYKNYIKLVGMQEIHLDDDLNIAGRSYTLKPKRFNQTVVLALAGTAFALLLVAIGSLFVTKGDLTSKGNLAGIVLDKNDQPFIQGVDVYLPEIDLKLKSNAEGFFKTGPLDAGTYKLIYSYKGSQLGAEYVTVTKAKISMMALRPTQFQEATPQQVKVSPKQPEQFSAVEQAPPKPTQSKKATQNKTSSRKTKRKSTYASLDLQTNIREAHISIDGKSIGVGNLTYSNIAPGEHRYKISRDGFESVTGIIYLPENQTTALTIEMFATAEEIQKKVSGPTDYQLGMEAVHSRQYEVALPHFTRMIDQHPDHAASYTARADIYGLNKDWKLAHSDYLRAGMILRENGDYNSATTAYNKAIRVNKKSVVAYIGRGDCFLAENEPRAAIMDFEAALKYDKRNPDAYFGLGLARFQQDSYKKAAKHFEDARSLDRSNPDIYEYLILCYSYTQDEKHLRKSFERYAEIASVDDMANLRADSKYDDIWTVLEDD